MGSGPGGLLRILLILCFLDMMHQYHAYGLRIRSAIRFPELVAAPDAQAADLTIVHDALPDAPDFLPERSVQVHTEDTTIYAHWTRLGTYAADNGTRIRFRPAPYATPNMQRLPLVGVMMGLILHQRGVCTMHGSAVALPEGAVAFVGPKGAGKSTTAAALQDAGYPLLSDDVLALHPIGPGPASTIDAAKTFCIEPAFPQIKLWPDAAAAVGQSPDALDALAPRLPKRAWRARDRFARHAAPLQAVYVLDFGDTLTRTRLAPREAFAALLAETYAPRFVGRHGTGAAHFQQITALVKHVPVYRLSRPRNLDALPDLVDAIAATAPAPRSAAAVPRRAPLPASPDHAPTTHRHPPPTAKQP